MTWITGLPGVNRPGLKARKCDNRTRMLRELTAFNDRDKAAYYEWPSFATVTVYVDDSGQYRGLYRSHIRELGAQFPRKQELAVWLKGVFEL